MEKLFSKTAARAKNRVKTVKKKIVRVAAGITATASIFAGTVFTNPTELMSEDAIAPETAIVCVLEEETPAVREEEAPAPEEKKGVLARIKRAVQNAVRKLPAWTRAVFIMPLCAVGWGLIFIGNALWHAVGIPVVSFLGKWLVAAAVVFGLVALALKLLFPDVKMKELFNKRNVIALGIVCLLMALTDPVCERLWPDKHWLAPTVCAGLVFCLTVFVVAPVIARRLKRDHIPQTV